MATEVAVRLVDDQDSSEWVDLRPGTSTVGRKKGNHVYVDNPKCSRVHATIEWNRFEMPLLTVKGRTPVFFQSGGQSVQPGATHTLGKHDKVCDG